jgi:hypothetical protein
MSFGQLATLPIFSLQVTSSSDLYVQEQQEAALPYLLAAELRLLAPAGERQLTQARCQTRGEGVGGGGGGGGPARPLPPTPPAQHAQCPLQHLRHG